MFCPSQDSSVWLGLTSREQLMLTECSKHQLLRLAKMLVAKFNHPHPPLLFAFPPRFLAFSP